MSEKINPDIATEQFFFALDGLCDALIDRMKDQEYFAIANAKERFLIMHKMVQVAVTKWFDQVAGEMEIDSAAPEGLTPREQRAWEQTLRGVPEQGKKS